MIKRNDKNEHYVNRTKHRLDQTKNRKLNKNLKPFYKKVTRTKCRVDKIKEGQKYMSRLENNHVRDRVIFLF